MTQTKKPYFFFAKTKVPSPAQTTAQVTKFRLSLRQRQIDVVFIAARGLAIDVPSISM